MEMNFEEIVTSEEATKNPVLFHNCSQMPI